ncbi:MAG: GNAT family N-acetyltransferase [Pacificimonas sp.]|jgi:ribosomal-protein-alanine N-acetyltransferase|nr:GNAT family N-acetyltransferase [Pacificimonas sp.]
MISFRRAAAEDTGTLGDLSARIFDPRFGEGWTAAQLAGTLGGPGAWCDLAEARGTLAGFSLCRTILDETELLLVGVDPGWRRQGLGEALVRRVIDRAAKKGSRRLHLEMRANNEAARLLYDRLGFSVIGRRPDYYRGSNGETYAAVTMNRELSGQS